MERKTKAGSFTAYLECANRAKQAPSTVGSPVSLLTVLAATKDQKLPLDVLRKVSGMEFSQFAEGLKGLQEAGFVDVTGAAGSETVELTANGAKLADSLQAR